MTLQPLDLPGQPVKATAERRLHPLRIIRRQECGQRSFDDERLRYSLAAGMIGELARKIRRQTKRVLGSHYFILEVEAVAWIHRGLARQTGNVRAQHASAYGVTVALVFREVEL